MIIISTKINKSKNDLLSIYNILFLISSKKLKVKTDYNILYPIYYRKIYYYNIYGNLKKKVNNFLNPNKTIQISTFIAKNKITYFFPIKLAGIIID